MVKDPGLLQCRFCWGLTEPSTIVALSAIESQSCHRLFMGSPIAACICSCHHSTKWCQTKSVNFNTAQDGVKETGVSLAFTVRAMDAGPVLAQEASSVDDVIQAPELLSQLFQQGTQLLLQNLPLVASGKAAEAAQPQVCLGLCSCKLFGSCSVCSTAHLHPSCRWPRDCRVTEQDISSREAQRNVCSDQHASS